MKFCEECGFELKPGTAFCGGCRAEIGKIRKKENTWTPALQTEEGRARFNKLIKAQDQTRAIWISIFLISALAGVAALLMAYSTAGILGLVFSFVALAIWKTISLSESDYYTVPGSRDTAGNHRCIHCGKLGGIRRKGEYKTNDTHASCTGCGNHLWTN